MRHIYSTYKEHYKARSGGFALSLIEATPAEKKSVKKWKCHHR